MAQKHELTAQTRSATVSKIRSAGSIPGVVYGQGIKNESIEVDAKKFGKIFAQTGYTSLVNLMVGNTTHTVLIKDVQFHPLKDQVTHIDFHRVRLDEKVKADVPLNFTGESAAIKDLGGVLVKSLDALEVEAFPQDLPHDIPVDISALKDFESVIHISDLTIPEGVTIFKQPEDVVALVQAPRSEQELEALAEEVKEDVAAVETVEKKEATDEEAVAEGDAAAGAAPEAKKE